MRYSIARRLCRRLLTSEGHFSLFIIDVNTAGTVVVATGLKDHHDIHRGKVLAKCTKGEVRSNQFNSGFLLYRGHLSIVSVYFVSLDEEKCVIEPA